MIECQINVIRYIKVLTAKVTNTVYNNDVILLYIVECTAFL